MQVPIYLVDVLSSVPVYLQQLTAREWGLGIGHPKNPLGTSYPTIKHRTHELYSLSHFPNTLECVEMTDYNSI